MRILVSATLVLFSSACFATRNDVRILQGDIFALKTQQAQSDSARARQFSALTDALNGTLGLVRDSLRELGTRLTTFQGATRQELYSQGQQLLRLEALLGQSSVALERFKTDLEERNRALLEQQLRAQAAPVNPGDTTAAAVTPPPIVPSEGPNTLYEISRNQLLAGAFSAAREGFARLLTEFPESDRAPDAQLSIAETFQAEKLVAQEDSTYRVVIDKYPRSVAAPKAMYKLGLLLDRQGKRPEARSMMQQLLRLYPTSDEYNLASDWLTKNP
jgi:TolA-binding protein